MKQYCLGLFSMLIVTAAQCQDSSASRAKKQLPSLAVLKSMDGHVNKGWLYKVNDDEVFLVEKKIKINLITGVRYGSARTSDVATPFPVEQINELNLKKKNAGLRGALIGFGTGAVVGAVIGFASGDDEVLPYNGTLNDLGAVFHNAFTLTAGQKAAVGALCLASIGTIAGFCVGSLAKKTFIIGGDKAKMSEMHQSIRQRAMLQY